MKKEIYVIPSCEVMKLRMESSVLVTTSTGAKLEWGQDQNQVDYFDENN